MKKFTGIWQILTGAPEKKREAFFRLTIWTVLNSAVFRQKFCAECHIFLTRPSKFEISPDSDLAFNVRFDLQTQWRSGFFSRSCYHEQTFQEET